MEPRPNFKPFFGPDDWRNRSNLNRMTISELVSELRDTFIRSDFDLVEETLIAREEKLKGEIDQKKNEIELLKEKFDMLMLEKVSVEMELKRVKEERSNGELGFGRCSGEVGKKRKVGNGVSCGGDFEGGRVLVNEKRGVGEQSKKDGVGASGDNFDRVDETLVVREAMLKQATEEKLRELLENSRFKSWGMLNFEIEVNTVTGERHGKEIMKLGENEKYKIEVLKNRGEDENVEVLAKTLVVREAMLKAAAEEKVRELQESNQFNGWGRLNFEVEVKTVTGERREAELMKVVENGNGLGLNGGKVLKAAVGHEKGKFEGLKNRGVGNGEACAVAELDVGKVEVLAKKKRFVGEPGKKDALGSSDTERLSSSRAVKANLATRLSPDLLMSGNDINSEEPLEDREAKLKEEIEEKIRLLHRKNQFKSFGMHDFDVEAHKVNGEWCGEELVKFRENGNGTDLEDGNVMKAELGNERHVLEVVKNSGDADGEACAVSELKGENVKDSAERKRLAGEPSKKDGQGSSDTGEKCSFRAVRRNFATKPAEPSRIFNRVSASSLGIAATLDILEELSSDSSSSSSSSSSSGEFDFTFLNSNKKIKTNGDQR